MRNKLLMHKTITDNGRNILLVIERDEPSNDFERRVIFYSSKVNHVFFYLFLIIYFLYKKIFTSYYLFV